MSHSHFSQACKQANKRKGPTQVYASQISGGSEICPVISLYKAEQVVCFMGSRILADYHTEQGLKAQTLNYHRVK